MAQGIFEVKDEHGHDSGRLAESIISLREMVAEHERTIASLQTSNTTLRDAMVTMEAMRAEHSSVIAVQEKEIENHSLGAQQQKELLATLQHKYTNQLEATNKALLALAQSENARASEASAHSDYMEKAHAHMQELSNRLDRRWATQKQINGLVDENKRLIAEVNKKRWFKLSLPFTTLFSRPQIEHVA